MRAAEAFESRAEIEQACQSLISRLLIDCDAHMDTMLDCPSDVGYLADQARIDTYYGAGRNRLTFPGKNRFVRPLDEGLELWFRFEFAEHPFAGLSVFDSNVHELICFEDIPTQVKDALYAEFDENEESVAQNCWWLKTFDLPKGGEGESPNFLLLDDYALSLLDEEAYNEFMKAAVVQIETFYKRWLS